MKNGRYQLLALLATALLLPLVATIGSTAELTASERRYRVIELPLPLEAAIGESITGQRLLSLPIDRQQLWPSSLYRPPALFYVGSENLTASLFEHSPVGLEIQFAFNRYSESFPFDLYQLQRPRDYSSLFFTPGFQLSGRSFAFFAHVEVPLRQIPQLQPPGEAIKSQLTLPAREGNRAEFGLRYHLR